MENEKNVQAIESDASEDLLIQEATLFDDWFFRRFMKDYPEGAELIIRICLNRDDLHVVELRVQEPFDSVKPKGKEGILDVWAKDDDGRAYNIEVQYDSRGASPKRAFYYLSLMTQYETDCGDEHNSRPDCYVIFITKTDYFGGNRPYYWVTGFRDDGKIAEIGAYIIYINGAWKEDDKIGHLVRDMAQPDPQKMHYSVIARRAGALKNPRKEEKSMSGSLAYLRDKWMDEGRNEGIYEHVNRVVSRLKISLDEALDILGISQEEYQKACDVVERLKQGQASL